MTGTAPSFVARLECSETGAEYPAGELINVSEAGAPLLVRYDLERVRGALAKEALAARPPDMWRMRELLPLGGAEAVSLGETMTPVVPLPGLARELGVRDVLVKDEGRLPTGSFKARGMAVAVSMAKALGVTRVAIPTAGNAGSALAAYATRAGMESYVFTPADTPEVTAREIAFHGAHVWRVDGIVHDCGRVVAEGVEKKGWFDFTTLKEPYRVEGKKTMGLELAEQLGWRLPDAIFYPTGGGTGYIGMWKAFQELAEMGWIDGPPPRMVAVQSTGCAPIVKAFNEGAREVAEPFPTSDTDVHGVRVPAPFADKLILNVAYDSNGFATAVDDAATHAVRARMAAEEGLHLCPEGAACVAALIQEREAGRIGETDRVVVFNSASGLKSPMPPMDRRLDTSGEIDFSVM